MSRYGMVIDLHNCVGCGACALACKTENNTGDRMNGQSFNWADFTFETSGTFPDVRTTTIPVLCNHCEKAPCVEACPTSPKSMYKTEDGITMHNDDRCIGCRACQEACPYSALDLDDIDEDTEAGLTYSVISFNETKHACYDRHMEKEPLLAGCTSPGLEIAKKRGMPPWRTSYSHSDYTKVRRSRVTEKCTFCHHLVANGKLPRCVDACPSGARLFGDLEDENSNVSAAIRNHQTMRLKEEAGTDPRVYYIRSYSAR